MGKIGNKSFRRAYANRLTWVVLLLVVLAFVSISVFGWGRWLVKTKFDTNAAAKMQTSPVADPPVAKLTTLTPDGFIPSQISHPKGKFLFVVEDRTGVTETQLVFERVVGNEQKEKLRDVKVQHSQPIWVEEQDLQPGEYQLSEASHPNWKLRLTITPR